MAGIESAADPQRVREHDHQRPQEQELGAAPVRRTRSATSVVPIDTAPITTLSTCTENAMGPRMNSA
jgi:hypothetical protein